MKSKSPPKRPRTRSASAGRFAKGTTARRVVVVVVVVGLLWAVGVAASALSARKTLSSAEQDLLAAKSRMASGDVNGASTALDSAGDKLRSARARLFAPHVAMASVVPVLGRDVAVARTMADAANSLVVRTADVLSLAKDLAAREEGQQGLPVGAIKEFGPVLRAASDAATDTVARISDTARPLTAEVRDGRSRVLETLEPIAEQLSVAADLVDVLPSFLGAEGPRRYLVGAANPAEMRGVGGYLGSYSVLEINDGDLNFSTFLPLNERENLEPDDIPRTVLSDRYFEFGGTWRWKNANMTPDMPSAARTLTLMWARQTGQELDGVIIVDPFALETMLRVTGPVNTPEGELSADSAVAFLTNEAYAEYDDTVERKESLGDAAKVVLQEFLGRGSDLVDRVNDLGRLVSERQLLLYSTNVKTQAAFTRARIDGSLPDPDGEMLAVVVNSATNAKTDFYLERTLRYEVELLADRAASGILEVEVRNEAPREGQPLYVIGPNVPGLDAGENRFYLSTYCSSRCEITGAEGGQTGRSKFTSELGHPVAGSWVQIPSGRQTKLTYAMATEGAWDWQGGDLVYRLQIRTQTAVRAPRVEISVAIPDGFRFGGGSEGIQADGDIATFATTRRGDVVLEFRFSPN